MEFCPVCNKPLPIKPPSQKLKYCSMKCMGLDRRTLPTLKTCEICGKQWKPLTRFQAARNTTCSQCKGKKISLAKKGKPLKPPRMTTCKHCQMEFQLTNGRKTANYCSYKCAAQHRIQNPQFMEHLKKMAPNMKGKTREPQYGASNPAWKGGVTYFKRHGSYINVKYVHCPQEYIAMARKDGYVMEHRLVMAQHLGRCLYRREAVHHIDHDPRNNHISNLQLFPNNTAHKRAEGAESRLLKKGLVVRLNQQ